MKNNISKIIYTIYCITLVGFIILGIVLVLMQLFGIFLRNGAIVIKAKNLFALSAIRLSIICAFTSFLNRYLNK
ncbi:hypothetical protein LDK02_00525 [Fusobacterium animalis]|uniref:hypothetical protein n=1 Tax=Fusobacterium animalis TaxID=76859 RepID=UPI0030CB3C8A